MACLPAGWTAPITQVPTGTLEEAPDKVWKELLRLVPLVDAALAELGNVLTHFTHNDGTWWSPSRGRKEGWAIWGPESGTAGPYGSRSRPVLDEGQRRCPR